MGSRIKLRICTWNVGNAQPPANLQQWIGVGLDNYDLIVVGAQEANFGSDKTTSPTSILSSPGNPSSATESMEFPPMSPGTPEAPASSTRRLRKLGKVISGFTKPANSWRTKKRDDGQPVDSEEHDIPRASSTFPLRSGQELIAELNRTKSDQGELNRLESDEVPVMSLRNFTKRRAQFDKVDESLLIKRRQNSQEDVLKTISMDDPLGDNFIAEESLNSPKKTDDLTLDGLKDLCADDNGPVTVTQDTPLQRRSRRIRQSMNKVLRTGDDNDGEDSVTSMGTSSNVKKFSQVVEKNMPPEYHLIAKHHLMEIKLLVFIHDRHRARVTKTEAVTEATGIGNVVGNKGAVAVKLTLDDTTFCFVCSHLAAHEGAKFLAQRNDDVIDIMRNIERDKVYGLPVIHQFNHIFWMGDLNYRLDLKHLLPAAVTWSHEERFAYVSDLISASRYDDLSAFDELRREMKEGHVFSGFTEGKLNFAPTFKVARGKVGEYQPVRVPSYCDRILWHSLPLHRNHVKLREYGSLEILDTSDHKPVYGVFELVIPGCIKVYPMPAPRDCLKCTIDFLSLKVSGLYEKRVENDGTGIKYEVLEDGALAISPRCEDMCENEEKTGGHTRRVVTATFHGNGIFLREKTVRTEVPLRAGRRESRYDELPAIAIRPVGSLQDLTYKYVTIVFARLGSRTGSSCVLPFAKMVQMPGRHRVETELELTKYGVGTAKVLVDVELVVSLETWIDTKNNIVRARYR